MIASDLPPTATISPDLISPSYRPESSTGSSCRGVCRQSPPSAVLTPWNRGKIRWLAHSDVRGFPDGNTDGHFALCEDKADRSSPGSLPVNRVRSSIEQVSVPTPSARIAIDLKRREELPFSRALGKAPRRPAPQVIATGLRPSDRQSSKIAVPGGCLTVRLIVQTLEFRDACGTSTVSCRNEARDDIVTEDTRNVIIVRLRGSMVRTRRFGELTGSR